MGGRYSAALRSYTLSPSQKSPTEFADRTPHQPTALREADTLNISCTCKGVHEPIVAEFARKGVLKGELKGNCLCWFGLLVFITKDISQRQGFADWWKTRAPSLLRTGSRNISGKTLNASMDLRKEARYASTQPNLLVLIRNTLKTWSKICKVRQCPEQYRSSNIVREQHCNNTWARKTFINSL